MNNNYASRLTSFATVFLIVLSLAFTAFAEGGNGDGTGGGKDKPLALESSSVANGSQNVSLTPRIVLNFNKNVVHFTVKENNMKCFSMTDANGKNIPVNVEMGDDQVDPSIKRIVTIVPVSPLEPETTYLLKIGRDITSKSGVTLGKDSYISFTTAKAAPATQTAPSSTAAKPKPIAAPIPKTPVESVTVVAKQTSVIEKTRREITHRAVTAAKAQTPAQTTPAATENSATTPTVTSAHTTQQNTADYQTQPPLTSQTDESESIPAETSAFSESATGQTSSADTPEKEENGGLRKAVPYIIPGIIAVIAVPAIAFTIKKKKDNNI